MAFVINNDLAISHLSAEQKHHFLKQVLAEDDLKSFYNTISSGDTTLVDLLVKYRGLEELPQELESLLAESYARLKIQNVPLPSGMEVFVESKLIDLRFFNSKDVEDKQCTKVSLLDVKTRIKLTCLHAERMTQMYSKETRNGIDGEFILLGRFVAQNIHILKRQLKGTYTKLPWEEMEFLLICFISAVCAPQEADITYQLVLDRARLLKYLNYFVIKLQQVEKELKETDVSVKLALGNRSLIIRNILKESPDFGDMYGDHDLMKSVYSLKRIRFYIRLALDVNPNEGMEVMETLILERTLQVVGESLKNTPESPNVSEEVHQLLARRAPRQARELSTALRDCLSHSRGYTRRPEQGALFRQRLRQDLRKIDAEIAYILYRKMKDALRLFVRKVINSRDEEELKVLIHKPSEFRIDDGNFSNNFIPEYLKQARELFEMLKENVVDKTRVEDLFHKAEETLRSEETRINDIQKSYAEGANHVVKLVNNFSAYSDVTKIKITAKICLLKLTPESPPSKFKSFLIITTAIYEHLIEMKDRDAALRIDYNILESIIYRTFAIVEFMAGRIGGIDEFRNKIDGGSDDEVEEHQKVQQIFDDVVNLLERQQDRSTLQTKFERCIELHRAKGELIKHFDSRLRGESTVFDGFASCVGKLCLKHKNFKDLEKFYEEGDYGKCKTAIQITEDHYGKFSRTVEELSLFSREKYAEALRGFFGTLKLKGKANLNLISTVNQYIEKRNQNISSYFSSRLPILDGLLSHGIAKPHDREYAAVEMLVLELTEILDNISFFGDGALFLDQFTPVLIGKNLRNYLAHGDLLADNLLSDPCTAVMQTASLLVRAGSELISQSGALIGGNIVADFGQLQRMYDMYLGTVVRQGAMFDAIEKGCEYLVKDYVSNGVDVNGANFEGWTGLHYAAAAGCTQILQLFLKHGVNLHAKDIYCKTPVQIAYDFGRMIVLKHLVDRNYLPADYVTPEQNSLLHLAARLGQADDVLGLLNCKNVNSENLSGQTPLLLASEAGHNAVVQLLLEKGSTAYAKYDEIPGHGLEAGKHLHIAAHNGHIDVVKILLNHVDDRILMEFIRSPTRDGSRALHLATERGHAGVVEELLARGSSIEEVNEDGRTALHVAASNGFTTIIKLLLNKGAAVNITENRRWTSLHLAVRWGHAEAVHELLGQGGDAGAMTEEGYTALHIAACNDNTEILQILLDRGARIEALSQDGSTALHVAGEHSQAEAVKRLIKQAKKLNQCSEYVNFTNEKKRTALHVVAVAGDEECAKELLGAGATLDACDYNHCTPLHVATQNGKVAIIRMLTDNGCDINAVTTNNSSALHIAVGSDVLEAVTLLIQKGIKLDIANKDNETAFFTAVAYGNKEMVKALLGAVAEDVVKAFINIPQRDSDQTALHFAVKNGYKEITTLLLDAGANVDATDIQGNTSMLFATMTGNMDIFLALLEKNANINKISKIGQIPLFHAASGGHLSMVKKLIAVGCDPHQIDTKGHTALHQAARNGHTEVVEFLLKTGIDIEAGANDGFTALHLAAFCGYHDVAVLLIKNKANVNKRTEGANYTPLHCASSPLAAVTGRLKVVKLLLDDGADVTRSSNALRLAATNERIVEALLEAGAEVDVLDEFQQSALHRAAHGGQRKIVSLLLDYRADPELRNGKGQTPLVLATLNNQDSIVEYLVSRGVNVNAACANKTTALHSAALNGKRGLAQLLLDNGANINCTTDGGQTPLHISAMQGFHELVSTLITRGANVDVVDGKGFTALHHGVASGNLMVVEELVKFGALNHDPVHGLTALMCAVGGGYSDIFYFLSSCLTSSQRGVL